MTTATATAEALTWHSVAEAASLTGMSERTLWRRIRADEIPNRTTDDHRRLVGLRPEDLSVTSGKLATVASAASGAMRAAHGLTEALRVIEAQAADRIARADAATREASDRARASERSASLWRALAVALTLGMAAVGFLTRGPTAATAVPDVGTVAWHPPLVDPDAR
jgi:hypothetical protein